MSSVRGGLASRRRQSVAGLLVRSAFSHEGAARSLVHRLKYEAVLMAADVMVEFGLMDLLPKGAIGLVPVPRTRWRVCQIRRRSSRRPMRLAE